ncbi:hypothetical protein D3C86_1671900 [compost metagenome]
MLGDHLVGGGHAGAGIDHEQHRIGFLDGLQGLLGHFRIDAFLVAGDTAGVDDDVGATLPLRLAVLAVTGQTGVFGDYRVAGLGQAVEQGGLADVGPTHQGDYGNHEALHWLFQKTQRPLPS